MRFRHFTITVLPNALNARLKRLAKRRPEIAVTDQNVAAALNEIMKSKYV